ncbi:MAG TPA: DUF6687 family protein [Pyrinomonadaceae bacterium]|nr:DUF6687 family protein [Pyrinomonadaceae bacterium]
MRFEYYHAGLANVPKLSVDGTVENAIHFSHWQGNRTPAELRADTSTEIALNLVRSSRFKELTGGIELVTNNHFDTDGVLSVWTVLAGGRSLGLRDELIAAAEAGDFSAYTNERAIRASLTIQGADSPVPESGVVSPLARRLAGAGAANLDEARAYELVLPEVERVLTRTQDYEALWREGWEAIAASLESFASGASRVAEDTEAHLSVITLASDLYGTMGFKPTRHVAPYTAISRHARGRVYLIATPMPGGWSYRIDYPYYSWAVTTVRPPVVRRDFAPLVARLNELEQSASGRWQLDATELTSAVKFKDARGAASASRLEPDAVAKELRGVLIEKEHAGVSPVANEVSTVASAPEAALLET